MADKVAVNKALADLGAAKMSNVWTDDVTHVVMDEIILTIKATDWIIYGFFLANKSSFQPNKRHNKLTLSPFSRSYVVQ